MESIHHNIWRKPRDFYVTGQMGLRAWIAVASVPIILFLYYVYQVYLHPLSKYPGPLLAKFTLLHGGYHAWKGDLHLDIWKCHQKYGPIVRYGPEHISFDTSTGLRDIYGMGANTWKHRQFAALNPRAANLVTMYDKKEHAKRRRLIGPAFTDTSIKRFEDKMLHHIHTLCEQIKSSQPEQGKHGSWGPGLKMSDWCAYLVFDITTEFLFGANYHLLESNEYRYVLHDIEDASSRNAVLVYLPFLTLGKLDKKLFPQSVDGTRGFWKFVKQTIASRSTATLSNDVFTYLTKAKDVQSGTSLSLQDIQSESGILTLAGLDTTTSAMCALFFYLSRNMHAYHELASEIRSTFSSVDDIRLGPSLHNCKYLHACVDESLRITPPIGSCPWREVGEGGTTIDGHFFPEGYSVGIGIYSVHHNEANFPRPHEFIPERWLIGDDEQDSHQAARVAAAKASFAPFSIGGRGCIGRSLAYSELLLMTAVVIWKFDFRAPDSADSALGAGHPLGDEGRRNPMEYQIIDRVMGVVDGPMIQFRQRV